MECSPFCIRNHLREDEYCGAYGRIKTKNLPPLVLESDWRHGFIENLRAAIDICKKESYPDIELVFSVEQAEFVYAALIAASKGEG